MVPSSNRGTQTQVWYVVISSSTMVRSRKLWRRREWNLQGDESEASRLHVKSRLEREASARAGPVTV